VFRWNDTTSSVFVPTCELVPSHYAAYLFLPANEFLVIYAQTQRTMRYSYEYNYAQIQTIRFRDITYSYQ